MLTEAGCESVILFPWPTKRKTKKKDKEKKKVLKVKEQVMLEKERRLKGRTQMIINQSMG